MIKNFELTAIEARKFTKPGEKHGNIRIDHNSSVTLISPINDEDARVDFRFTASYAGVGVIKIEGSLVFSGNAHELASQWQSNNQMPPDVANQIHTAVMGNCIPEAVMLARDLRLPPPIPMPKVNIPSGKKGKARAYGPEVA